MPQGLEVQVLSRPPRRNGLSAFVAAEVNSYLCWTAASRHSSFPHKVNFAGTQYMNELFPESPLRLVEAGLDGFEIFHGLDDNLKRQLIRKSRQKRMLCDVPKDAQGRFKNRDSLEQWLSKGREVYPLVTREDLAGIIWYGEKPIPIDFSRAALPHHTFAIRLYERYRAKGLATRFMDTTLRDYQGTLESTDQLTTFRGLWLSSGVNNIDARGLYQRYGYKEVVFSEGEVIMLLPNEKIAERLGA